MTRTNGLWSALSVLEYLDDAQAATKTYPTTYPNGACKCNRPSHTLSNALALVAASDPNAESASCCAIEIQCSSGVRQVTVRIAQNQLVDEHNLENLRQMLATVVAKVDKVQWRELCGKHFNKMVQSIAMRTLLPLISERCQAQITRIFRSPYNTLRFQHRFTWAESTEGGYLSSVKGSKDLQAAHSMFESINATRSPNASEKDRCKALIAANEITKPSTFRSLVDRNPRVDTPQVALSQNQVISDSEEGDRDDAESLTTEELYKTPYERFLREAGLYAASATVIVYQLARFRSRCSRSSRFPGSSEIRVETTGISVTKEHPSAENEFATFEDYLSHLGVDIAGLDEKAISPCRDGWTYRRTSNFIYLHAEMQMAMFYALNPSVLPINGFLGVSKRCCWSCDFVLQRLQAHEGEFSIESAGPKLLLAVGASHAKMYANYIFPDPKNHFTGTGELDPAGFDRLCHRFKLIRQEMQLELDAIVRAKLPTALKQDTGSDSGDLGETRSERDGERKGYNCKL